MDEVALGRVFRRVRLRLGWRQLDVADEAGVSPSTVSLIERGQLGHVTVGTLRRVGAVLQIEIRLELRWRGGELFRLLAEGHAAMAETVTRRLVELGWEVRPEVSFSHFGERGVVDLVAWHGASRSLLLVELKTELVDLGDLLATMDRRRRLATVIRRGPRLVARDRRVVGRADRHANESPPGCRSRGRASCRLPDRRSLHARLAAEARPSDRRAVFPAISRRGSIWDETRHRQAGRTRRGERFRRPDPAS